MKKKAQPDQLRPALWALMYADGAGFVMDGDAPFVAFDPCPTGPETVWAPLFALGMKDQIILSLYQEQQAQALEAMRPPMP